MKNFVAYIGSAVATVLLSSTAFAGGTTTPPPAVPEPSALTIIGGVAVAAFIANRFIRRK